MSTMNSNCSVLTRDSMFIRKLYRILSHENTLVAAWDVCGKQFTIRSISKMEAAILPHYFRSSDLTYSSFRRQLMAHGFTLVRHSTDSDTFRHPLYTRSTALNKRPRKPTTNSTSVPCPPVVEDNLWQVLASACLYSSDSFINPSSVVPQSHSNPLFHQVEPPAIDGWAALSTPAVVCL
ncbi:hypothetical protein AeMF1_016144 [Aphanomyces euteiches]|nr:hypothetical protein AeMF1_016144 [Aphanomyces euteiches]KAH9191333.1 hypothetical protein AeNC1_006701 [Aphanomyces euteiches]